MSRDRSAVLQLRTVHAVVFLAFLDTFALLPVVAPYAASLGADARGIGVVVAAYSATNLVFNVVGGILLDRVGRRPLAVVGLVGAAASVGLYVLAGSTGALVGARLLHGAAGGVLVPALFTLTGDLAAPGARGRAMGRAGAAIGAAAVAGPALAGIVRGIAGFAAVFGLVVTALAAGALIAGLVVRETAAPGRPAGSAGPRGPEAGRATRSGVVTRDERAAEEGAGGRARLAGVAIAFAAVFGFTSAFGTLAAFLPGDVEALGASPATTGALFTLLSAVAAALMLSPAARWVDRAGAVPAVRAGMALFLVALGLLAFLPPVGSVATAAAACVVFGVGFGLLFPAATGAVAIAAPAEGRGRAFGLFNASYSLGFVVGAPAAGAVTHATGASPYLVPAAACAVVLAVALARRPAGGEVALRRP